MTMQIIGPTYLQTNKLLYTLEIQACTIINNNDRLSLDSYTTTNKDAIEYYALKHEIKTNPKSIKFELRIEKYFTLNPSVNLFLSYGTYSIPVPNDMDDFFEKEKIIIGTIESQFPGWMDKQFQTPIIKKLFLNIREF